MFEIRSWSIKAKLIAVLALLVSLMLGLGTFAIDRIRVVDAIADDIRTKNLVAVQLSGEMSFHVAQYGSLMLRHILTTDDDAMKQVEERMDVRLRELKETQAAYEKLAPSPEERKLYEEFSRNLASFLQEVRGALDKSRRNENEAARDHVFTKALPAADSARNALGELVRFVQAEAAASGEQGQAVYELSFNLILAVLLVALAAGAGLGWLVVRSITRGIASVLQPMKGLAVGELSVEIPFRGAKTEMGAIADAVQVFKDALIEKQRADEAAAAETAAKAERARRLDELTNGFDKAVSTVLGAVSSATSELQATAGSMAATAEETSRQSVAVAAASEQASTNVQTVASAAEELSSSIQEISRQVQQSAQVAGKAAEDAARTNGTVQTLAEAAQKIGDVVKLINDIASQTNLLALNATIEAARAGDAGKGFAVVASEVKSLANQTAKATEEIGAQISAMQSVTGEAVSAITSIGATIGEINQIATTIASAVEEQGAATQEIARNVQQAAAGTQEVSSNIAGVQQAATDTGAASQQVLSASGELAQQSELLRRQVDAFLADVKAA
jgi:methyl-accepting chemotaxis protein